MAEGVLDDIEAWSWKLGWSRRTEKKQVGSKQTTTLSNKQKI